MTEAEFKALIDQICANSPAELDPGLNVEKRKDFERIGITLISLFTTLLRNPREDLEIYTILPVVYRMGMLQGMDNFKAELLQQVLLKAPRNPNERPN